MHARADGDLHVREEVTQECIELLRQELLVEAEGVCLHGARKLREVPSPDVPRSDGSLPSSGWNVNAETSESTREAISAKNRNGRWLCLF